MVESITYEVTLPDYEALVSELKALQLRSTEILIRLNEDPRFTAYEIPSPLWTPDCSG